MENVFDSLGTRFAARANALVAKREAEGLNVHFTNASGQPDRRSFRTVERAEAFRRRVGV
jgi:hypothetical protein